MHRLFLMIPLVFAASPAMGQPEDRNVEALVTTITTDAGTYAEGEAIEIRVTISNPTDSSAVKRYGSGCISQVWLDEIPVSEYTACTLAVRPITFPAYSSLAVVWRVEPLDMGWPTRGGVHTLVGSSVGEPDTTTFEAPAAMGGRVYFRTVAGLTHAHLASLRDSLAAEVLFESDSAGRAQGDWRVRGAPLDTIVARYQDDSRFDTFEAYRWIVPTEEIFSADELDARSVSPQVALFPNPASETIELAISAPQSGGVTVEVFDARGRLMLREEGARPRQLDVSAWPSGVYTVRVRAGDASATQRVTVAR